MRHNKSDVTIIDVAREAGVSYATVSRVINNKAHVHPDKRARVVQAMQELGYVVNQQARSLAGGRTQVIGLLLPRVDTSYIEAIIRGVDVELDRAGYDLVIYTTHRRAAKESSQAAMLSRGMADGLLLLLPNDAGNLLHLLRQRQTPCVLIDHPHTPSGASVGVTNKQGALAAMHYLLGLGHRRIGCISGNLAFPAAVERLQAYEAALRDAGIAYDPALVRTSDFTYLDGYYQGQALLALADPPTAIFACNDMMALGALEAIREAGLRVPHDISVVGFDDIPETRLVKPPLTTVRQPMEDMGRTATRMLLQMIDHPHRPIEHIDLPTELVIRESCQSPRALTPSERVGRARKEVPAGDF